MSIALDNVDFFRAQWADRFSDTADITRLTNRGTLDDDTLEYDGTPDTLYAGLTVLVRPAGRRQALVDIGETSHTYYDTDIYAPWNTTGLKPDDELTITASEKDPDLPSAVFRVRAVDVDTYRTRLHIRAERDLGPGQEV